jgi:hypothetical protein
LVKHFREDMVRKLGYADLATKAADDRPPIRVESFDAD